MMVRAVGWLVLCAGLLGGLPACSKESMLRSSLEEPEERKDTLELTLKVFDDHPEYVDELFALAQEHPTTFQRLLENTATELEDPAFAAEVSGHYLCVSVIDDGTGIPEAIQSRVFEPFFTTKGVGDGSGQAVQPWL